MLSFKTMQTKHKTKQTAPQHSPLFMPIRTLIFQLPVEERLEIYHEIQDHDWKKEFWQLHESIGQELKTKGLKVKDIGALIEKVRREKTTNRT